TLQYLARALVQEIDADLLEDAERGDVDRLQLVGRDRLDGLVEQARLCLRRGLAAHLRPRASAPAALSCRGGAGFSHRSRIRLRNGPAPHGARRRKRSCSMSGSSVY